MLNEAQMKHAAAILRYPHKRVGRCCGLDDCLLGCPEEEPYCYMAVLMDPNYVSVVLKALASSVIIYTISPEEATLALLDQLG